MLVYTNNGGTWYNNNQCLYGLRKRRCGTENIRHVRGRSSLRVGLHDREKQQLNALFFKMFSVPLAPPLSLFTVVLLWFLFKLLNGGCIWEYTVTHSHTL